MTQCNYCPAGTYVLHDGFSVCGRSEHVERHDAVATLLPVVEVLEHVRDRLAVQLKRDAPCDGVAAVRVGLRGHERHDATGPPGHAAVVSAPLQACR